MAVNENQLTIVKKYEYDNILLRDIDYIINRSIRDCYNNYFQPIRNEISYNIEFEKISNNEKINLTISDKSLNIFYLNKKLKIANERGYIFNKIIKLTIKLYDHLSQNNIHNYYKFQCPILMRQILKIISCNNESIQNFCNIYHNLEFEVI